jgi:hypothetical protein
MRILVMTSGKGLLIEFALAGMVSGLEVTRSALMA